MDIVLTFSKNINNWQFSFKQDFPRYLFWLKFSRTPIVYINWSKRKLLSHYFRKKVAEADNIGTFVHFQYEHSLLVKTHSLHNLPRFLTAVAVPVASEQLLIEVKVSSGRGAVSEP